MALKLPDFSRLLGSAKTRTVVIFVVVMLVVVIGIIFTSFHQQLSNVVPTVASTVPVPDVDSIPGSKTSPVYQKTQQEQNVQQAQQAEQTGGSAVATITSNIQSTDMQNTATKPTHTKEAPKSQAEAQLQQQIAQQERAAQTQLTTQNIQNVQQQTQTLTQAMTAQAKALLSDWTPSTQQYVPGADALAAQGAPPGGSPAAGALKGALGGVAGAGTSASAAGQDTNGDASTDVPADIKSGDIIFAVMDTAVNSDEPGPVMATIVEGKYKGAKLLGKIQHTNSQFSKKLILVFNTMSIPDAKKSIKINAVAVDPSTSRTALATSVDNHYLMRYGTLAAAAFLQGYGSAVANSGSIQTYSVGGNFNNAWTQVNSYNTAEELAIAAGQVGETLGYQLAKNFDRPPTIKVSAGLGVGILFLADLTLPPDLIETDDVSKGNGDRSYTTY